jgi:hypothetical protein
MKLFATVIFVFICLFALTAQAGVAVDVKVTPGVCTPAACAPAACAAADVSAVNACHRHPLLKVGKAIRPDVRVVVRVREKD